jgi:hypothetical protein
MIPASGGSTIQAQVSLVATYHDAYFLQRLSSIVKINI